MKGGLDDFKLYFENLPPAKGKVPSFTKKRPETPYIVVLVASFWRGLITTIHYLIRQCEAFYKFAILNIDDRTPMQKLLPTNKAVPKKKGKG